MPLKLGHDWLADISLQPRSGSHGHAGPPTLVPRLFSYTNQLGRLFQNSTTTTADDMHFYLNIQTRLPFLPLPPFSFPIIYFHHTSFLEFLITFFSLFFFVKFYQTFVNSPSHFCPYLFIYFHLTISVVDLIRFGCCFDSDDYSVLVCVLAIFQNLTSILTTTLRVEKKFPIANVFSCPQDKNVVDGDDDDDLAVF